MVRSLLSHGYRTVRRVLIAATGAAIVAVGVAMLVLPGPAFIVIPAGLAVLALEFTWARRLLHEARARTDAMIQRARGSGPDSPSG
jgi:uncharacterized protein (TIGR02611 family)